MRRVVFALVFAAGCYRAPASDPACTISCEQTCPGDLTCTHGYCVGAGERCEPSFQTVHAGNGFACALDSQRVLWCWGANAHHQLVADDTAYIASATQIGNDRWDAISTGGGHICALREDQLYCWGENDRGQISDAVSGDVVTPMQITTAASPVAWTDVVAGYSQTCAIGDGRLYCWGANDHGQLGTGTTSDSGTPAEVMPAVTDWFAVSTGPDHSCAISRSAGLHCWGDNADSDLGDGTTTAALSPIPIMLPGAQAVAVGLRSTCAITDAGQLYCWGYAGNHALGDPTVIAQSGTVTTPTLATLLDGWTSIASAEELACGQRADELWCWGRSNGGGGLANGIWTSSFGGSGPRWGQAATGIDQIAVGWNADLVDGLGTDAQDLDLGCVVTLGQVRCWGDNRYGQLGQGTTTLAPVPTEIAGAHHWTTLVAGLAHVCGLENGAPQCWGATTTGQANALVSGDTTAPCDGTLSCDVGSPQGLAFAPAADEITAGANHTCLRVGGQVTCWGDNSLGQLGTTTAPTPTPLVVAGTFTRLVDGLRYGTCASDGVTASCWGLVFGGAAQELTSQPEIATATRVAADGRNSLTSRFGCFLDQAHALVCYGSNAAGQFGNGVAGTCGDLVCNNNETCATCPGDCGTCPLNTLGRSYQDLSVGIASSRDTQTTCGIRIDGMIECWGYNRYGVVGPVLNPDGSLVISVTTPQLQPDLTACTAVSVSDTHACALCGGEISCWGDQRSGGLGSGPLSPTPVLIPRKIDLDHGTDAWAQLVSGRGFTCARTESGRGYCWGFSAHGALGTGGVGAPLPVTVQYTY